MTVLDLKAIGERIKASLGTEDEPFEGEVPMDKVEEDVMNKIHETRAANSKAKFVFDGITHKEAADFINFINKIGVPDFILYLETEEKAIKQRFCAKNEVDEVGEEQVEELKQQEVADKAQKDQVRTAMAQYGSRVNQIELATHHSLETTQTALKGKFAPKVVLVNHEKRLGVDTTCANLAIKYNMIYISVYQLIKSNIESKTPWGLKLQASKREKALQITS